MKNKKILIVIAVLAMVALAGAAVGITKTRAKGTMADESKNYMLQLGVGYNLGNSLDVCDWSSMFESKYGSGTETMWGGAAVTESFIKRVVDSGFSTVRVPVTYMNHIDKDGNIDEDWLKRVDEVVSYVINSGMYCIIDIHHDTGNDGWIRATAANYDANSGRVRKMIAQIAGRFNKYDDHLILEGFNEMVDDERHWDKAPSESLDAYNKWNQLFVDTVRTTGGNNSNRYLLINTYASTFETKNVRSFKIPDDTADNKIIVGVHNYTNISALEDSFKNIDYLLECGYPVIIGEFGAVAAADFDRAEYAEKFVALCRERGYCPIWWDNNENPDVSATTCFSLFDRKTNNVYYPEIVKALTNSN